jgi:hypothetical protein
MSVIDLLYTSEYILLKLSSISLNIRQGFLVGTVRQKSMNFLMSKALQQEEDCEDASDNLNKDITCKVKCPCKSLY